MAKLLTFVVETYGTTKVTLDAKLNQSVEVAKCNLTWFPLQQTVHVWFAMPALYNKHGVATFQKFKGTLEQLVDYYMNLFQQMVWLLLPVLEKRSSLDMILFQLKGLHPCVSALVRCFVNLKKNIDQNKSHDKKKHNFFQKGDNNKSCGSKQNNNSPDSGISSTGSTNSIISSSVWDDCKNSGDCTFVNVTSGYSGCYSTNKKRDCDNRVDDCVSN
jgi:hypothetical protein